MASSGIVRYSGSQLDGTASWTTFHHPPGRLQYFTELRPFRICIVLTCVGPVTVRSFGIRQIFVVRFVSAGHALLLGTGH
jgi:hypothetical protein